MNIKRIVGDFTVCKVADLSAIDLNKTEYFLSKTEDENSLLCKTEDVPQNTLTREDGWRAFRIEGTLEFSLIGILAKISTLLAEEKIGLLAVSTFNTDYFFVKKEKETVALKKLSQNGYHVL